jgi:hypothetical protein
MEPRGCNGWQSVANQVRAEAAETSQKPLAWVATGCRRWKGAGLRFESGRGLCKSRANQAYMFGTQSIANVALICA